MNSLIAFPEPAPAMNPALEAADDSNARIQRRAYVRLRRAMEDVRFILPALLRSIRRTNPTFDVREGIESRAQAEAMMPMLSGAHADAPRAYYPLSKDRSREAEALARRIERYCEDVPVHDYAELILIIENRLALVAEYGSAD